MNELNSPVISPGVMKTNTNFLKKNLIIYKKKKIVWLYLPMLSLDAAKNFPSGLNFKHLTPPENL